MSIHGASITPVFPDKDCIPQKDLKRKISEILITGNDSTQEPDNPRKKQNWIVALMKIIII